MDPTKYRFRLLVGIFLTAILIAAVLRHVLHVHAGFTREEILIGALAVAIATALLTLYLRRRRRRS
jgi:uncharacterized oligopeptide transporter (OPT) family protein